MTEKNDRPETPGVVHDIKQMLAVITGRAGLLLQRGCDTELERHLNAMLLAAEDAAQMLKRLDGPGVPALPAEPVQLRRVVAESASLVAPPEGGMAVDNQVPDNLWAWIPAQILREVMNNLLLNARAVLPDGGTVTVTAAGDDAAVSLRVVDTGPGVDPGLGERIFEPGVTSSGKPGRGLGLAGCRGLLGRFGGKLKLDPCQSGGAAFILELPLAREAENDGDAALAVTPVDLLEPGEILVVDDEIAVQEMMADLLGELGWRPTVAPDAEQAQAAFRPGRYPVALVDQSLPGMSGLELASALRKQDPEIVLVLVTGWGNEDIISRAPDSGFDLTAEKPLTVGKIRHLLGQAAVLLKARGTEREES